MTALMSVVAGSYIRPQHDKDMERTTRAEVVTLFHTIPINQMLQSQGQWTVHRLTGHIHD